MGSRTRWQRGRRETGRWPHAGSEWRRQETVARPGPLANAPAGRSATHLNAQEDQAAGGTTQQPNHAGCGSLDEERPRRPANVRGPPAVFRPGRSMTPRHTIRRAQELYGAAAVVSERRLAAARSRRRSIGHDQGARHLRGASPRSGLSWPRSLRAGPGPPALGSCGLQRHCGSFGVPVRFSGRTGAAASLPGVGIAELLGCSA